MLSKSYINNPEIWQAAFVKGLAKGVTNSKEVKPSIKDSLKTIVAQLNNNIKKAMQDLKLLYPNS